MATSLGLYKIKPNSYLSQLNKSRYLIAQKTQEGNDLPGKQLARLFSQATGTGRNREGLGRSLQLTKAMRDSKGVSSNVKSLLGPKKEGSKKFKNKDIEAIRAGITGYVRRNAETSSDESLQLAKDFLIYLGADPGSVEGMNSKEDESRIVNVITFLLTLPATNPGIDQDGFTEPFAGSLLELSHRELNALVHDVPPSSESTQASSENTASISEYLSSVEETPKPASQSSQSSRASQQEILRQQINEAQAKIARGEAPAQGAGAAASVSSFMSSKSFNELMSQQSSAAEGPAGGVLSSMSSDMSAAIDFALGLDPLERRPPRPPRPIIDRTASTSTGSSFVQPPPREDLGEGVSSMTSAPELPSQDSLIDAAPASQGSFFEPAVSSFFEHRAFTIDPAYYAEYVGAVPPGGAGLGGAGGGAGLGGAGGAAGGGAGLGAGANAGGGAQGPNNAALNADDQAMRIARLFAQQNGIIAAEILKAQKKPIPPEFLSTEEMNRITFERNLDARRMKAENLFKDYQNANRQDMQNLIELQRYYNDRYRVPLAK